MSIRLMSAIWENGPANSTQRFVLLALADHGNDDGGNIFPAIDTIARKTALSERTVIRAIEGLVQDGYLIRQRRQSVSNAYHIVLARLSPSSVSDKMSLTEVTECHPVSDNLSSVSDRMSPPEVTNRHPVSDNVSHDPSLNHQVNHQGGTIRAREPEPQAAKAAPPPPIVRTVIPDRTPGRLGASSYLAEPDPPEPDPAPRDPAKEAHRLAVGAMADALTDVTGVSAKLNGEVIELAIRLVGLEYEPGQIRRHYGRSDPGPGVWWWFRDDWRGRANDKRAAEPPRLKAIRETIVGAVEHNAAPITQKQAGPVDRFLAGLGLSASPASS